MSTVETRAREEFEYKAEMKQLLHIIVHSLYTHPEIFLRELVSNASDALNKLRFRRLTDHEILNPELELKISIEVDKENQTFSISDSGIGMTKDELINQIGTVASSGTMNFLNKLKQEQKEKEIDGNLIGQFGVGFYSVFMVTDEINIETRSADSDSKTYLWKSVELNKFAIEEIEDKERGTRIYFKLKDEYKEYADPERIKSILKKYSNFVDFPVYVNNERVNIVSALWHRKKEDVKKEELDEFYKFITNDFEEPMAHLLLSIEGVLNFRSLLFIPQTAPPMLFRDIMEKSLSLYSNKVFITDENKELLPDYLKFIKGVVDTEDVSLNVSREVTQSSPVMTKIKNVLTGKILGWLEEISETDKEMYHKFFRNFGSVFKTGVNGDYSNRDKIIDLLRFETTKTEKGDLTSFKEYVSRMGENQKELFYITGDNREAIERNPNLEYFKKNDLEVIILNDPVDIFTYTYIFEYEKQPLKSIEKADIDLSKDEEASVNRLNDDLTKSLLDVFKEVLRDKVEDVRESKRLVDSPVTLVVGTMGLDPQMEKIMQMMEKDYSTSKRILEINPSHKLIKNLAKIIMADNTSTLLKNCIEQLYEGALLNEGYLKSPADFSKRMIEIMEEATK